MRDNPAAICRSVLFAFVFLMSACASASAGPLSDRIYQSLETGDTGQMYRNVRLVFEEMGVVFSSGLTFRTQPYDAPSAWYHGVFNDITYPRLMLPEESHNYWTTLSRRLTDGAWNPGEIFKDEQEQHLLGNYHILTILAHEIGHYTGDRYGLNTNNDGYNELVADRLTIMFLYDLSARDARFLKLLRRYRDVMAISLHDAAPQQRRIDIPRWGDLAAFSRKMPLPDDPARNVSLHLALHRRLMEDESYKDHSLFFNRYIQPVNEKYRSGTVYESPYLKVIDAGEINYEYARHSGMLTSGRLYRIGITKQDDTDAELQLITRTEEEPESVTASYSLRRLFPEEVLPAEIEDDLNRHEPDFYYLEAYIRQICFLSPDEWVIHFEERPDQDLPQRLFHFSRDHQGKISNRLIPVDSGMFQHTLIFSIIGLDDDALYFSRIVSQGDQEVWEYGRVGLVDGNTLILARHSASRDQTGIFDGPVQPLLTNAEDLVKGAVSGPDQTIYFTHGDMVKIYQGGVIKTVAGSRDGDEKHPTGDCFWHPHVIGLDAAGRLFIKSSGKITTPGNIQITHHLKIIAPP